METSKETPGTYAISSHNEIYTAFDPETLSLFLEEEVVPKFYEGKYPFFDDKNSMVKETEDKREVWFNGKKISFFIQDYSAIRFQARLALSINTEIKVIASETSRILLSTGDAKALLESLNNATDIADQENSWYQQHGEEWSTILAEAFKTLGLKSEVV